MENLQAPQAHEHAAPPLMADNASSLAAAPVAHSEIIASGLLNEHTQKMIVDDYKANHFDLLQNKGDKIKALSSLVAVHAPFALSVGLAIKSGALDKASEEEKTALANNVMLEQLYTTSLINDFATKTQSPVTEQLKDKVIDSYNQMFTAADNINPENIKIYYKQIYEDNISNLVGALELGKEKSFLDNFLH